MTLLMVGSNTPLMAQSTDQGATIRSAEGVVHAAATPAAVVTDVQIVLGMFFILLGLFVHALIVLNEDKPVPVHVAKKRKEEEKQEDPLVTKVFFMSWK